MSNPFTAEPRDWVTGLLGQSRSAIPRQNNPIRAFYDDYAASQPPGFERTMKSLALFAMQPELVTYDQLQHAAGIIQRYFAVHGEAITKLRVFPRFQRRYRVHPHEAMANFDAFMAQETEAANEMDRLIEEAAQAAEAVANKKARAALVVIASVVGFMLAFSLISAFTH